MITSDIARLIEPQWSGMFSIAFSRADVKWRSHTMKMWTTGNSRYLRQGRLYYFHLGHNQNRFGLNYRFFLPKNGVTQIPKRKRIRQDRDVGFDPTHFNKIERALHCFDSLPIPISRYLVELLGTNDSLYHAAQNRLMDIAHNIYIVIQPDCQVIVLLNR